VAPRLAAFVAIVVWGISFVASKVALREMTPVGLVFTRFALGTAVLAVVLAARGRPLVPPRGSWRSLAVLGFVGVLVHQMLQAHALELTSATNTGWLIGLTPIWSALLAAWFLGERFGAAKLAGLAVGFAGAVLVVAGSGGARGLPSLPAARGDLLIVLSTVNWAVYTILGHRVLRTLGAAQTTTGAMFLGWLMVAPVFLWQGGWREWPGVSTAGWTAVAFLGIACSGLGYLLWYRALARLDASQVAAFLYLEPLVTLVAAAVVLGEPVRGAGVAGGALVLLGVYLVQRRG
jgi:drug/metabolite transporter (DMT)-like permease